MKKGMDFLVGDLVTLDIPACTSHLAWPKHLPAIVPKVRSGEWGLYLDVMTPEGPREWLQRETKVINRIHEPARWNW